MIFKPVIVDNNNTYVSTLQYERELISLLCQPIGTQRNESCSNILDD